MKTIYSTTPFLTTRYFGPASFLGYRDILTREQWKLLKAIAHEGEAYSITSEKFTQKKFFGKFSYYFTINKIVAEKKLHLLAIQFPGNSLLQGLRRAFSTLDTKPIIVVKNKSSE